MKIEMSDVTGKLNELKRATKRVVDPVIESIDTTG